MMLRVGAVLLAAGASRRFGTANKLTAEFDGSPLIRVTAGQIIRAGIAEVIVVTGWDRSSIESALQGLPLRLAHNQNWADGLGSSIAVGVSELSAGLDGALIVPGDMPLLTDTLIGELVEQFSKDVHARGTSPIAFPATRSGEQRNPVLWPSRYFPLLASLRGPEGGKQLLRRLADSCSIVWVGDDRQLLDIDEPRDLDFKWRPDRLRKKNSPA